MSKGCISAPLFSWRGNISGGASATAEQSIRFRVRFTSGDETEKNADEDAFDASGRHVRAPVQPLPEFRRDLGHVVSIGMHVFAASYWIEKPQNVENPSPMDG